MMKAKARAARILTTKCQGWGGGAKTGAVYSRFQITAPRHVWPPDQSHAERAVPGNVIAAKLTEHKTNILFT